MAVILGINTHHAGSSAALVVDGQVAAAVAEERLNRIKYYAGFPAQSIISVLKIAGLSFKDIDMVAIARDSRANLHKKIEYVVKNPGKLLNLMKIGTARSALSDIKTTMAEECGVDLANLRFEQTNVEHHLAHIASAYYISSWDYAAGFSMDGSGDFVTCMLAECKGKQIEVKQRIYVPHSLGSLYTMVCQFIGYGKYGDEGKVMGLAPYGADVYAEHFDKMVKLLDKGFELNADYFLPFGSSQGVSIADNGEMLVERHYSDLMIQLFGQPLERYAEISTRDKNLAFGLQQKFEEVYMHMLNILHRLVPTERVAMAGGAVLNSVANGKLFDHTPFRETCIQPAAGDEGLALGAALYVSQAILGEKERYILKDAYLGAAYSDSEIRAALDKYKLQYTEHNTPDLINETATAIANGKVIGWYQGRMEWGPRALGNRSILAHPGLATMKDTLNARIKHREWFRPFAPVVLADRQADIFEKDYPSPFMLHVYKIKPEWRERLQAVNHVDNTGRLQTVTQDENELYYKVVQRFEQLTGLPVLINTSFNENEPIVNTPSEAVDCFVRTRMDMLVIGSYICKKSGNE
jgi:carbamoyltransferase